MMLPYHKTKIVCTIGPACSSPEILETMIRNGMNVARINLSYGNYEEKRRDIKNICEAARRVGRIVTILADLPGQKIRVGKLRQEPATLVKGEHVTLSSDESATDKNYIPVEYKKLAESVKPGSTIYLNDGFIELRVENIGGNNVNCKVIIGGELLSHKGLNIPGAKLFVSPVTDRDLELMEFGMQEGVDTFGVSFIEKAEDIMKVKGYAKNKGKAIKVIAKIERAEAVKNFEDILSAADGIMIARGDLGVEMPIADVPMIQKKLINKSNLYGRPVITATQMLESMKTNTRPTRAEVSDVANAILDGTDAVMLSEETAIGNYPAETVEMMSSIAVETEKQKDESNQSQELRLFIKTLAGQGKLTIPDVISRNVIVATDMLEIRYIVTPTETGSTARRISRFKPNCWILAYSRHDSTCRFLSFSYGVFPFFLAPKKEGWYDVILDSLHKNDLVKNDDKIIITEGRFVNKPGGTDSLGILTVGEGR